MSGDDLQNGYDMTHAPPPRPDTQSLGPARYTIMEEYSKNCIGAGTTTTTIVKGTGETEVHTFRSANAIAHLMPGIPRKWRQTMTFHDEIIVLTNEYKLACYPWQFEKTAVPKYKIVSLGVAKYNPVKFMFLSLFLFVIGVPVVTAVVWLGVILIIGSVVSLLLPFLSRKYYISLQTNAGTRIGMARTKTHTFAVGTRPDTEFVENYVYGPLSHATETLHTLSHLKHGGFAGKLRIDDNRNGVVPLATMAHQGEAQQGGGNAADAAGGALGGLLCELRLETAPMFGCCGMSTDNVAYFHQDGVRIEKSSRWVPYPESFSRAVVHKHRVVGCKVRKLTRLLLQLAAGLMGGGLLLIIIGAVVIHIDHRVAALLVIGILLFLGGCFCLYAPFLPCSQNFDVLLDVTEGSRRWLSISVDEEPDADFIFSYVYHPLSKWSGAYHCQAHLENDNLVKPIVPDIMMASLHPPIAHKVHAGAGYAAPLRPHVGYPVAVAVPGEEHDDSAALLASSSRPGSWQQQQAPEPKEVGWAP